MSLLSSALRALGVSLLATVGLLIPIFLLVSIGIPPLLVSFALSAGLAYYSYGFAVDQLESNHPGLWAAAAFVFGVFSLPFLRFAHERRRAHERATPIAAA
jgi:hypothetical protein